MNDQENATEMQMIPYFVHESDMARMENNMKRAENDKERLERINKRLWITVLVCLAIIAGMFIYEAQYVDESWTFESSTDGGGNAIANGNGEVNYYGTGEGNAQNQSPQD